MNKERWDKATRAFLKKYEDIGWDKYKLPSSAKSEELDKFVTSLDALAALELLEVSLVRVIHLRELDKSLDRYVFTSHVGGFAINCRGEDFFSREDYRPVPTRKMIDGVEISAKEIIDYITSQLNDIAAMVLK